MQRSVNKVSCERIMDRTDQLYAENDQTSTGGREKGDEAYALIFCSCGSRSC